MIRAPGIEPALSCTVVAVLLFSSCSGIRLEDIEVPRPIPAGSCLIVGFLGGRDAWNDDKKGVRQTALRLSDLGKRRFAETFENRRRDVAEAFVREALDLNGDRTVGLEESQRAHLVVYGQSLGGSATLHFARQMQDLGVPIRLTVQIDSVGRGDGRVPPNVRYAANLYQDNGWLIAGEHPLRASDPSRTTVIGEWCFDYDVPPGSQISVSDLPWYKTAFRVPHAKMDRDPRVWALVEHLVLAACGGEDLEQVATEILPSRLEP